MIERAEGERIAAPSPCTARAAISCPSEFERPQASEASVNSTTPNMKIRLRPSRSAARPPRSRKPPNVRAYALSTHCRFDCEKFRSLWIDGSATLTIETSRMTMKNAEQRRASAHQRFGSGTAGVATSTNRLPFSCRWA